MCILAYSTIEPVIQARKKLACTIDTSSLNPRLFAGWPVLLCCLLTLTATGLYLVGDSSLPLALPGFGHTFFASSHVLRSDTAQEEFCRVECTSSTRDALQTSWLHTWSADLATGSGCDSRDDSSYCQTTKLLARLSASVKQCWPPILCTKYSPGIKDYLWMRHQGRQLQA